MEGFSETDYPALFVAADGVSKWAQTRYVLLARIELVFISVSALMGASLSVLHVGASTYVAAAAGGLLIAAALTRSTGRATQPNKKWFEGRAVAESVKSLTWKYMMQVAPLHLEQTRADALFTRLLAEILGERALISPRTPTPDLRLEQITPVMRRIRDLPLDQRSAVYLRYRLKDQLVWYAERSLSLKKLSDRWFLAGIAFEALALGSAILLVASPTGANFIGVFSTATAATVSLSQLRGEGENAERYALAAQELSLIESRLRTGDEKSFAECVKEAEAAISREHKMWAAKRG